MRFHCSSNLVWKPRLFIEWASARVPPTPIFGALQIFSICHLFWSVKSFGALACRVRGAKKPLEGFGWFEAWQTAGLNATKKAIDVALKAKKKLLMWRWCVGMRGQGCQKSLWRVLEGFEGFEAWQTAGLNASKKLLMSPRKARKSCWCGLGALACGVRGAKKAFGGFWRVLKGLKPGKRQAWTPVKSYWCRLEGKKRAVDEALVPWRAGSGVGKEPLEGFEGFEAWQTAGLNASDKLLMSPWRPIKNCWCGLGALACGVQGCQKCFWRVLEGLRGFGGFEGFEAWQTAGLNGSKKLLMSPWRRRKSCWWLGASACGVRCAKKGFWRVLEGTAGLTASKKLLMSPWRPRKSCWCGPCVPKKLLEGFRGFEAWQTTGLNASKKLLMSPWRPRKSCWCGVGALACGVRGAKKALGGFWRVLKGLKPGKRQAWTPVESYWCRLDG